MRITKTLILPLALVCLAINANENNIYITGSILNSDVELGKHTESDTGYAVGLGYRYNTSFDFEVNVYDFGEVDFSQDVDKAHFETKGYSIAGIYKYPIGDLKLLAEVSYLWFEKDGSYTISNANYDLSSDNNNIAFGAGLSYQILNSFEIKAQYTIGSDIEWAEIGFNFSF
ncbi:outer membrane beta-barrel protein [Thalassotalea sp. ND16A]|uniref:outer membrane beta-barrel protein n=1 Tax=Thalassotalea sp. ND16A TaxID=1535422 RepID=UPI00051A0376|nr:outer membrane beta-barrel protein [Thalassotalea sp. ND16A]KGJ98352.1 hypothetical protein ND16A_0661 [Thalassotalea sp. ND16A]